ncbi:MAG: sensor histidine kinase, partial [Acidimicrobiales bacterium]
VDTPPPLYVNSRQLERAVSNLVDNALKFSRNDSSVHVSITSSSLAVSNEADVIAEEDLPHLFDRFYRAPTARQIRGSGLGLAIVAEFVRDLGGTTFARNEASEITNRVVVGFTLPTKDDR